MNHETCERPHHIMHQLQSRYKNLNQTIVHYGDTMVIFSSVEIALFFCIFPQARLLGY